MAREHGIEPQSSGSKPGVLPLDDSRMAHSVGFGPTTFPLTGDCSTAELQVYGGPTGTRTPTN